MHNSNLSLPLTPEYTVIFLNYVEKLSSSLPRFESAKYLNFRMVSLAPEFRGIYALSRRLKIGWSSYELCHVPALHL